MLAKELVALGIRREERGELSQTAPLGLEWLQGSISDTTTNIYTSIAVLSSEHQMQNRTSKANVSRYVSSIPNDQK